LVLNRRAYTAFLLALLVYTAVNIAASSGYTKAVLTFATNMLIAIIGLQALDGELDARPICNHMPRAVMASALLVYIFVLAAAVLAIVAGMADGDATYVLNFTKNAVAVAVALAAANVMERAAKACDAATTLAMLSMALAFGLIAVV
jgi:hypothetical protein